MSLLSDLNNKIRALSTRVGDEVKSLWEGVNTAQSTATAAQTTANTAQSTATAAQTTANTAQSTATAAQTTANTAKSTADTANSTANSAKTTANTAQSTANTANSTANTANSTANTANATANNALAWSWQVRGTNIITSTNSDTTSYWGSAKPGLYWFSQNGCLINQPAQYGWLLNLSFGSGVEVAQLWKSQAGGNLYLRGGNASGWANNWTPVSFNDSDRLQFRSGAQIWVA